MMYEKNKLLIECEDDAENAPHPHCPHGPTLLFYNSLDGKEKGYYTCAAFRDKRSCNFYLPVAELTTKKLQRRYDSESVQEYRELRRQFLRGDPQQQYYCHTCNVPVLLTSLELHKEHNILWLSTDELRQDPTNFLAPMDDDKAQAQYFFDSNALKFFANNIRNLGITKVVCIGAPRLHIHLHLHYADAIKSYLLDLDHRFFYFFDDDSFAWYNMCNNHFFDKTQKLEFHNFLKCNNGENLLIFTDPPFGCRTEPIAHTLRQLTRLHNEVNQLPHRHLPIFWIFPYFAEHYIRQQMDALEMCDYKVNYTNHGSYTEASKGGRELGSPVRLFTDVPLKALQLPINESYKYCKFCEKYTSLENRHCKHCGLCPSKNGTTYRHCKSCSICVKPSYVHCTTCRRCTQLEGHNCSIYQSNQRCLICLHFGHTEAHCTAWQEYCQKMDLPAHQLIKEQRITCLVCGHFGHNERKCPQRAKYIEESTFLGVTRLKFKIPDKLS